MLFFTIFMFYSCPHCTWIVFIVLVTGSLFYTYMAEHCMKKTTWVRVIGRHSACAAAAGFAIGLLIHYKYMLYFGKYTAMMRYSNVAASQSVLQFEDASWLLFTEGTKVDTTRAVGYRNLRTSETLCVAPVIDGQMSTSDPIVFWAVGTGCCNWRASFNCDDAKAGGRNGLLILEPHNLVSDSMEWAVRGHFDKEGFQEAISLAESVFAMTSGTDVRYVRWVNDPETTIYAYRRSGVEWAIYSCVAYVILTAFYVMQEIARDELRQRKYIAKMTGASAEDL
jgi:hypothetical protein